MASDTGVTLRSRICLAAMTARYLASWLSTKAAPTRGLESFSEAAADSADAPLVGALDAASSIVPAVAPFSRSKYASMSAYVLLPRLPGLAGGIRFMINDHRACGG